jgi:branched-chain amino acid transport system substrate-binding protein
MLITIGVLLPRSTDFPAMGFDLLDGLKIYFQKQGLENIRFVPENIGFGEDRKEIYAKAEKCILQDDAQIVVAYLSTENAATLYPLFESTGKQLIVLDAGMNYPKEAASPNVLYISLQGIHSCVIGGRMAGKDAKEVILATSFFDGGFRGPWAFDRGISMQEGTVVNNYIGHHKESEFTIAPFIEALNNNKDARIAACFSTYLATLFFQKLSEADGDIEEREYSCSSFMFEEQTMDTYQLPKGKFVGNTPWISTLENTANQEFVAEIQLKKNKKANIFHLLGWEAGIILAQLLADTSGIDTAFRNFLDGKSYASPRGLVTIHPTTHIGFAPLYLCEMTRNQAHKASLVHKETIEISADEHLNVINDQPSGMTSGWFNNYLCS